MAFERLLAKSRKEGEPWHDSMSLPVHLADVHAAAVRVLAAAGDDQLRALGLSTEEYGQRLRRVVRLAAAVHDLGKANDHFQGMLRRTRDVRTNPQGLRHEWVTVLLLRDLRDWLLPAVDGSAADFAAVEWAVAGHHPAYDRPSPPRAAGPGSGVEIQVLTGHRDFRTCLDWLRSAFSLSAAPPSLPSDPWPLVGPRNAYSRIAEWFRDARRDWDRLLAGVPERRFVAAV